MIKTDPNRKETGKILKNSADGVVAKREKTLASDRVADCFLRMSGKTAEVETVIFMVQGSAAEPYQVRFVNRGAGNISACCTCPAGQNRMYCKHRFGIFGGQRKGIVFGNESDVSTVQGWLPGSDIEAAMKEVQKAEDKWRRQNKPRASAGRLFPGQ